MLTAKNVKNATKMVFPFVLVMCHFLAYHSKIGLEPDFFLLPIKLNETFCPYWPHFSVFWPPSLKSKSGVDLVSIAALDSIEQHRFPRPGTNNAKSVLKIVTFKPGGLTFLLEWNFDFHEHFPWCEYIPRMGWTPNGQR